MGITLALQARADGQGLAAAASQSPGPHAVVTSTMRGSNDCVAGVAAAGVRERECCLLVLNLVSSTLPCIRRPRPRLILVSLHGVMGIDGIGGELTRLESVTPLCEELNDLRAVRDGDPITVGIGVPE
jgi:hypothetical protein